MDSVKAAVYGGTIALVVALLAALYVVLQNASSRNLALAFGALFGAAAIFGIQVYFELKGWVTYEQISTEITIDRAKPEIRQWIYPHGSFQSTPRMSAELGASEWLARVVPRYFQENTAQVATEDGAQLATDFVIYSIAAFLGTQEFDWQLRRTVYEGSGIGVLITAERVSADSECTLLTSKQVTSQLSHTGNLFAGAPLPFESICLPPHSRLRICRNSLVIRTPICELSFHISSPSSVLYTKPYSGDQPPRLPNGKPQYVSRWVGISIQTRFSDWRAQDRNVNRYRDRSGRVAADARVWFQPGKP